MFKVSICKCRKTMRIKIKGNDTYGIYDNFDMTYDNKDFVIENEMGNETYNITGLTYSDSSMEKYAIKDSSGNDKYNFKDGESRKVKVNNVNILDENGKDIALFTGTGCKLPKKTEK